MNSNKKAHTFLFLFNTFKEVGFFFNIKKTLQFKCYKVAATAASYDLPSAKLHYKFVTEKPNTFL